MYGKTTFRPPELYTQFEVLSEKIQERGDTAFGNRLEINFKNALAMDTGAAMGIVDGIQFALDGNPELEIILTEISDDKIDMLKLCGLPESVAVNDLQKGLARGDNPNFTLDSKLPGNSVQDHIHVE